MDRKLKVIFIQEKDEDTLSSIKALEGSGFTVAHLRVASAEDFTRSLTGKSWDIVISTPCTPDFKAIEALKIRNQLCPDIPFILVSGKVGEDLIVQAMKDGVDDYIFTDDLNRLAPAVSRELQKADIRRQRNTALEYMRESEERYRLLVEHIDLGISLLDADFTIVMANPAMAKIFNRQRKDMIGEKCWKVAFGRDRQCELCPAGKALESGQPEELEVEFKLEDRNVRILKIRVIPVRDSREGISGFIEVVEDITDSIRVNEEMLKSSKLDSLGVFAAGIAHDFNNILTAVIGNISLAKMNFSKNDEMYEILSDAEKASLRAKGLTMQLLTHTRGGEPVKKIVLNIGELVRDTVAFSSSGSNIKSEVYVAHNVSHAEIDEGQISQVLNNMIINAQQAMPGGGAIRVRVENFSADGLKKGALKKGEYIRITIEDEGVGISKHNMHKIFDPYYTTKPKGNGLGLYSCYSIVKRHEGLISVESEEGAGSKFIIYLPVTAHSQTARMERGRDEKNDFKGKAMGGKILLMDDEEVVLKVAGKIISKLGYEVEISRDGNEAIRLYTEAMNAGTPYKAVVMDLTIPGGMGGAEAIKKLMEIDPHVKAFVSSGYSNDPVMANFKKYGFTGVITKPYKVEEFRDVLLRDVG